MDKVFAAARIIYRRIKISERSSSGSSSPRRLSQSHSKRRFELLNKSRWQQQQQLAKASQPEREFPILCWALIEQTSLWGVLVASLAIAMLLLIQMDHSFA